MNPNLVNNLTSLPFSSSRISSRSIVSSALCIRSLESVCEFDEEGSEEGGRGRRREEGQRKGKGGTYTKLEFNSSTTLPPISANTSSIVFLGPGLLSKYNTTFFKSGEYIRLMWSTDLGRLWTA